MTHIITLLYFTSMLRVQLSDKDKVLTEQMTKRQAHLTTNNTLTNELSKVTSIFK